MEAETPGLIQAAQQGDLIAFNRLVLAYQDEVYNLTCRLLGEGPRAVQAAQQAFLQAYRELHRYRDGSWRVWLYRRAARACRELSAHRPQDNTDHRSGGSISLQALPFDLRLVVALIDLECLNYEESAAILEISPVKMKTRLARARQRLAIQQA